MQEAQDKQSGLDEKRIQRSEAKVALLNNAAIIVPDRIFAEIRIFVTDNTQTIDNEPLSTEA